MQMYLPFCGIAISNAQLFAASRKEYERSRALLEVVNDLFEEQTDLEKIVKKIMHRAQTLLKCERCSVLLLEDIESPVVKFTKSFELLSPKCSADAENRAACYDVGFLAHSRIPMGITALLTSAVPQLPGHPSVLDALVTFTNLGKDWWTDDNNSASYNQCYHRFNDVI
ncbi:hypothetical protein H8959_004738 [Pygathrix nigripes]